MAWWIWMISGLVLLGLEALTPGLFFLLFFGIAALLVGALVGLGLGGPPWWQFLLFSILAVASLLLLRRRLLTLQGSTTEADSSKADSSEVVGRIVTLTTDLAPGAIGKGEARGSSWSVKNSGTKIRCSGESCRVLAREGLLLLVGDE